MRRYGGGTRPFVAFEFFDGEGEREGVDD